MVMDLNKVAAELTLIIRELYTSAREYEVHSGDGSTSLSDSLNSNREEVEQLMVRGMSGTDRVMGILSCLLIVSAHQEGMGNLSCRDKLLALQRELEQTPCENNTLVAGPR